VGAAGVGSFCEQVTQRVLTDPFFSSIINVKDIIWKYNLKIQARDIFMLAL